MTIQNLLNTSLVNRCLRAFALTGALLAVGQGNLAHAGDVEITLKLNAVAQADILTGQISLGQSYLQEAIPRELSLISEDGSDLSDQISINAANLSVEGVYEDEVLWERDGSVHLAVEPTFVVLDGHLVSGVEQDVTGAWVSATYPGRLVMESREAHIYKADSTSGSSAGLTMSIAFDLAEVQHEGGEGFQAETVIFQASKLPTEWSPILSDLPMHVQADPMASANSAGCNDAQTICGCGGPDGCNTLISVCFNGEVNGTWECISENDQGQCILGLCTF